MHLIFWQNFPNHLQSALICSLAEQPGINVTLISQTEIPAWRGNLGWIPPDFGNAYVLTNPDDNTIMSIFNNTVQEAVHILSGLRAYKLPWQAFQYGIRANAHMAVYSEPEQWLTLKGKLRTVRGKLDTWRYGQYIDFVLAVGHLGVEWFLKCGYSPQKIYQFGYFVDPSIPACAVQRMEITTNVNFQIVFIGQCIHRKGVDLLLYALNELCDFTWELSIIGDGDKKTEWEQLSQDLGINKYTKFTGTLPNELAMQYLAKADLLVLPSRWDGWGAVVNESLIHGVPVICSSRCGAADLLKNDIRGGVFLTGSVTQLRDKLYEQLTLGKPNLIRKKAIQKWANDNISGEAAANYMLSIVNDTGKINQRVPPWLVS